MVLHPAILQYVAIHGYCMEGLNYKLKTENNELINGGLSNKYKIIMSIIAVLDFLQFSQYVFLHNYSNIMNYFSVCSALYTFINYQNVSVTQLVPARFYIHKFNT